MFSKKRLETANFKKKYSSNSSHNNAKNGANKTNTTSIHISCQSNNQATLLLYKITKYSNYSSVESLMSFKNVISALSFITG